MSSAWAFGHLLHMRMLLCAPATEGTRSTAQPWQSTASSLLCIEFRRYHALLRTAKERGTVTYVSNLFDTFFAGGKDHRTRVSAGNMPYLEGVHHLTISLSIHAALPAAQPPV
jgi:hypothetical protein